MKIVSKLAAITAAGTLLAATAGAQNAVQFTGSTTGCFYTTMSAPTDCSGLSATTGNLTYTGSTFDATSNAADGLFTLGAAPGTPNVNNLGSFHLLDGDYDYTGKQFALFLNFTNPTGVSGNNLYTAVLTGNLTNATSGNVFIDFGSAGHSFTFSDGSQLNNFVVNPLSINDQNSAGAGVSVAVTGQGYARGVTATPEPSSLALLGTGLVGLVPIFRRKEKK